jgi:hypothetical protein
MTMRAYSIGIAMLVAVSACAKYDQPADSAASTASAPAPSRARDAALTANAIAANPPAADSILKAGGYTSESFQKLMYEIASDSVMSAEYAGYRPR